MQRFPATAPLEFVAIEVFRQLFSAIWENPFLLGTTDRVSELVKTIPLTNILLCTVAKSFKDTWVVV